MHQTKNGNNEDSVVFTTNPHSNLPTEEGLLSHIEDSRRKEVDLLPNDVSSSFLGRFMMHINSDMKIVKLEIEFGFNKAKK